MSDESVAKALRSPARLVVVEAPAGCGKTTQGSQYAKDLAPSMMGGRILILAHTHAACDVFSTRTRGCDGRVEVYTIDSLICQIAGAYHAALGLPADVAGWARRQKDGYTLLAAKVRRLLAVSPMIARSVTQRYPVVVCDEHQDASADQHNLAIACHDAGASVRIFGDPMQRIYGSAKKAEIDADHQRWESLKKRAEVFDELDTPHRWSTGSDALGRWILQARTTLRDGGQIDLRGALPDGLSLITAENRSKNPAGGYSLSKEEAKPVYALANGKSSLLVLAAHNDTVGSLCAFFNRRLPIWEGHVRDNLAVLMDATQKHRGDAVKIAESVVTFLDNVVVGFSPSAFSTRMLSEVRSGCAGRCKGKPAVLQELGKTILKEPDHRGAAKALHQLSQLIKTDPAFGTIKLDYRCEFWEAVQMSQFEDPEQGFAEVARRRTCTRPMPPSKAISTVHKAKGLECSHVLIIPCDAKHFGNTLAARCRLYVAMSRAMSSLTLVISRQNPSPLLLL